MIGFNRAQAANLAKEVTDHLSLIDNVKALQIAQKEIADAISKINDKIRALEMEMAVLKSEVKLESIREAQSVVYAVQSGFNSRIQDLAVKVGIIEHQNTISSHPARPAIGDSTGKP